MIMFTVHASPVTAAIFSGLLAAARKLCTTESGETSHISRDYARGQADLIISMCNLPQTLSCRDYLILAITDAAPVSVMSDRIDGQRPTTVTRTPSAHVCQDPAYGPCPQPKCGQPWR